MRLFIAVNFDEKIKNALMDIQDDMSFAGVSGNYTRPENMHLTLAFLGDYPDPDRVLEAMNKVSFRPFDISLNGAGAFRNLWWIGLSESEPLKKLVKSLRHYLSDYGIPYHRKKFSPHITLVRKPLSPVFSHPTDIVKNVPDAGMTVEHFSLMRSQRGKHGMIYTELGRVRAEG